MRKSETQNAISFALLSVAAAAHPAGYAAPDLADVKADYSAPGHQTNLQRYKIHQDIGESFLGFEVLQDLWVFSRACLISKQLFLKSKLPEE